jgi:hypothetical protein
MAYATTKQIAILYKMMQLGINALVVGKTKADWPLAAYKISLLTRMCKCRDPDDQGRNATMTRSRATDIIQGR